MVIVGAGVAGLAAAGCLAGRQVVVLERQPRLGGRVLTRHEGGMSYELGALFAHGGVAAEAGLPMNPVSRADGLLGLVVDGKRHAAPTVRECILAALDEPERAAFHAWAGGNAPFATLGPRARELSGAFLQAVHPGEIARYHEIRQRDALVRFANTFTIEGNQALIEALRTRVQGDIRPGTEVVRIEGGRDQVQVEVRSPAGPRRLTARAAIVATTAPDALGLVAGIADTARQFLEDVPFAGYRVGVLGIRRGLHPPLSYLVRPGHGPRVIYFQPGRGAGTDILCVYWPITAGQAVHAPDLIEILEALPLFGVRISASDVLFSDGTAWAHAGPVLTAAAYTPWNDARLWPAPRITLAGDYTYPPIAYGMKAAYQSGRAAAERIAHRL